MSLVFRYKEIPCIPFEVVSNFYAVRNSPIDPADVYRLGDIYGVDPVIATAFFHFESRLGLKGWGAVNANPGNLRLDRKGHGGFHTFASPGKPLGDCFHDGVEAWYQKIDEYIRSGLDTVEKAVPKYAPDDPPTYIEGIYRVINQIAYGYWGYYLLADFLPSQNHGGRLRDVQYIVMHHTAGTMASAIETLTVSTPNSAHFIVGRDGRIVQLVSTEYIAYHALWANPVSIGIEHEHYQLPNGEWTSWTQEQLKASAELLRYFHSLYPEAKIVRHRDLTATSCPGDLPVEAIMQMAGI